MAHVTGNNRIAAPPEHVFDTVTDSRLEPTFNPAMTEVERLTLEPIGLGTRFRARMANDRRPRSCSAQSFPTLARDCLPPHATATE